VSRTYRLGRRQAAVDRTSEAILAAARKLIAEAPAEAVSVGAVARRAAVSRLTVYNRFASKAGLLRALVPEPARREREAAEGSREALRLRFVDSSTAWAADPALYRHLAATDEAAQPELDRGLVERLAADDLLRPGCSIKEAEDVIGALGSFAVFDRLHKDGRRPPAAVAEVLMRLASGILA
jgi:AcrR family transcriptional regulator